MAQITITDEMIRSAKKDQAERERLIARQQAAREARELAAKKAARKKRGQQALALSIGLIIFIVLAFSGFVLRDYEFSNAGGHLQLVSRMSIPAGGSVYIDSSVPGKLTLSSNSSNNAVAYEYAISRFKNMMFSYTYRSEIPKKTIGMLKEGKKYYVRVRIYKKNPAGREVHGPWGSVKAGKVRESK